MLDYELYNCEYKYEDVTISLLRPAYNGEIISTASKDPTINQIKQHEIRL